MAKLIGLFMVVVFIAISADSHSIQKDRTKRAVPAAAFFKGVFTWIVRVLKFSVGFSFMETGVNQNAPPRNVVNSVVARLKNIQSAVDSLEQNILEEINQLKVMMRLHFAFSHHAKSVERLDELIHKFMNLHKHYSDNRANQWVTAMLSTDDRGADSVLFSIHKLIKGEKLVGREPIFHLFFTNAVDNQNQSRLWQTEAYADSLLSHQAILYGLWITALHMSNHTELSSEVEFVEDLMNSRWNEQLSTLDPIRRQAIVYTIPSDRIVTANISHFCSITPKCFATGYKLEIHSLTAKLTSNCIADQLLDSIGGSEPKCLHSQNRRIKSYFDDSRQFSATMLTVPDRRKQAICGVSITEEKVGRIIYIRLNANICIKNSSGIAQLADLPSLKSKNTQLRVIEWPYRLVMGNFPKLFGWVTGVGLEVDRNNSLRIIEETDYFPSLDLNRIIPET